MRSSLGMGCFAVRHLMTVMTEKLKALPSLSDLNQFSASSAGLAVLLAALAAQTYWGQWGRVLLRWNSSEHPCWNTNEHPIAHPRTETENNIHVIDLLLLFHDQIISVA